MLQQSVEKHNKQLVLTDKNFTECLVVPSHVPTLKHEAEQLLITQKQLFQLRQETNKQLFLDY